MSIKKRIAELENRLASEENAKAERIRYKVRGAQSVARELRGYLRDIAESGVRPSKARSVLEDDMKDLDVAMNLLISLWSRWRDQ